MGGGLERFLSPLHAHRYELVGTFGLESAEQLSSGQRTDARQPDACPVCCGSVLHNRSSGYDSIFAWLLSTADINGELRCSPGLCRHASKELFIPERNSSDPDR